MRSSQAELESSGIGTQTLAMLGYFYLRHGRPDRALTLYLALDSIQPGNVRTVLALALAQLRCGQPAKALTGLDRLTKHGPIDVRATLIRVQALQALGRRTEAATQMNLYVETMSAMRAASGEPT